MFDLERSIAEWRQQMLAAGIKTPAPLEELEIHLREEIEMQIQSGATAQQAFKIALEQIGCAAVLKDEFGKAGIPIYERLKQTIFALAGIQNYQLATNMNTNSNIEPRWATYAKAGTFLFPAVFLWLFSVVFLMPKLQEICQAAGTTVFGFNKAPFIFRAFAVIGQAMVFLTNHIILFSCAVVLAVILLEWRFNGWPRYRRATVGTGIFLFNFAVLLSITLMVISAIINPIQAHNATVQSGRSATSDEIRNTSAEEWFDRMGQKETALGYAPNTSLNVLLQKAKASDEVKNDIMSRAESIIDDSQQSSFRHWQSCYVLSGIGDSRGIPAIVRALKGGDMTVRGVAACALGAFDDPSARAALEEAAKNEKSRDVQGWIQKALDGQFLPKHQ